MSTILRLLVLWALVFCLGFIMGAVLASEETMFIVTVREQTTPDTQGLRHFDLITPKDGTRLSVMGDADLPLIHALGQVNGRKVRITIEPFQARALER